MVKCSGEGCEDEALWEMVHPDSDNHLICKECKDDLDSVLEDSIYGGFLWDCVVCGVERCISGNTVVYVPLTT